ncbi:hypothetical protein RHSIM_Rhsim03G0204500 [Rhododendron simsii]|uniref:Uncharacterized protein n=1 Tax=Rhododendron simsii TaxID=118357 RepID=A0A834H3T6_RHOSS|nr:hypothetical protein RHSIM_Rhsim03G0204500 [Rhododendron simsii]
MQYAPSELISCRKMFNVPSVPDAAFDQTADLQLKWLLPVCGKCEAKGKFCRLKSNSTSDEIECFGDLNPLTNGNPLSLLSLLFPCSSQRMSQKEICIPTIDLENLMRKRNSSITVSIKASSKLLGLEKQKAKTYGSIMSAAIASMGEWQWKIPSPQCNQQIMHPGATQKAKINKQSNKNCNLRSINKWAAFQKQQNCNHRPSRNSTPQCIK